MRRGARQQDGDESRPDAESETGLHETRSLRSTAGGRSAVDGARTAAADDGDCLEISYPSIPSIAMDDAGDHAPAMVSPDPEIPTGEVLPTVGSFIHKYEVIRELGRGGMGTVFLARDTLLGRLAAIKFLTENDPEFTARFITEARATARCRHENIVVIYEVGEHLAHPYMVLEYIEGKTLSRWLREQLGPSGGGGTSLAPASLPSRRVIELIIPVVRALVCAHEHGIVHRDLKPANIMLTDSGAVKVLDFGIAKLLTGSSETAGDGPIESLNVADLDMTAPGSVVGTLPYMSPEQLGGGAFGAIDHRSDIWAIGIILYQMVTGRHPLAPLSRAKIREIIDLDTPMPRVSEVRPDLGGLAGIIDRCLIKLKLDRTASARDLLSELEALSPRRRMSTAAGAGEDSPFAGLAAFQESDADRFYGRSRDIITTVARVRAQPLVALTGPSGSGKSSLLRAGVIPRLKRSGEGWEAFVMRPGRRPLAALGEVLSQRLWQSSGRHSPESEVGEVGEDGQNERKALIERLRVEPGYPGAELRAWARRKRRRVLLFVDQFEELYTLGADADERRAFAACLESAADDASSPLRVVISMRSDFLDRMAEDREFMSDVARGLLFLPPIDRDGLREALTRPVETADYRFETGAMVDDMVDALDGTRGALPLLQFAATRLWESRDRQRRMLTRAGYDAIGGIAGTLAAHADAVVAGMPAREQAAARAIFQRLVTPERTRAIASLNEIRELPGNADDMERVVDHLADARLLTIESGAVGDAGDGDSGDAHQVEIVHESLIESWPRLGRWLDENQEDAAFLARLRGAAREWHKSGRPAGLLWRDEAMHEARTYCQRSGGEAALPRGESEYVRAVFALADRAARRKRFLVAASMVLLAALTVAAVVALILIRGAEREASRQATVAEKRLAELEQKERQRQAAEDQARTARDKAAAATSTVNLTKEQLRDALQAATTARKLAEEESEKARRALRDQERARGEAEAAGDQARRAAEAAERARKKALEAADKERRASAELKQLLEKERRRNEKLKRALGGDIRETLD